MNIEAWVFFPAAWKARSRKARLTIHRTCDERGWAFQEFPTAVEALNKEGRSAFFVGEANATELYRRMHRGRLGVLSIEEESTVCLHPNFRRAVRRGELASLGRFSRYKAFAARVAVAEPLAWIGAFEAWLGATHCSSGHDPRGLPRHVFATRGEFDLDKSGGQESFAASYGQGGSRVDAEARHWRLDPGAFHGHECLHVGGYELQRGFHWDVTRERPPFQIWNTSQIWEVRSHINVFPDATLLGRSPARRLR